MPSPTSSTIAAASWPSAIGIGRGRSPLITERSEWHKPAATILISTSSRPGGARSTVVMTRGLDVAYGGDAPILCSTAALIFMKKSSNIERWRRLEHNDARRAASFRSGMPEGKIPAVGPARGLTSKGRLHLLKLCRKLHIFCIVNRAVDQHHGVVRQSALKG